MAFERASQLAFFGVSLLFGASAAIDRLVRVHVGDGRDADARRLDDVHRRTARTRSGIARPIVLAQTAGGETGDSIMMFEETALSPRPRGGGRY
jgi:hypothetical protein